MQPTWTDNWSISYLYLPRSDTSIWWWDFVTNSGSWCCFSPRYTIWTYLIIITTQPKVGLNRLFVSLFLLFDRKRTTYLALRTSSCGIQNCYKTKHQENGWSATPHSRQKIVFHFLSIYLNSFKEALTYYIYRNVI